MAIGRGAFISPIGNLLFPEQTNSAFDYLKGALFGKPAEYVPEPSRFSPQQLQFLQNALQQGQQGLGTEAIEGAARRGFRQETIPLLSERFGKGFGSSGYENILQGAGTDLETQLAKLRQENSMNLLNLGLQPTQDYRFEGETPGLVGQLLPSALRAGAAYATGGASEAGNILNLFQSLFGGSQQPSSPRASTGISSQSVSPFMQQQGPRQQAYNMMQQGGAGNIQQLLGQATMAGLPGLSRQGMIPKLSHLGI